MHRTIQPMENSFAIDVRFRFIDKWSLFLMIFNFFSAMPRMLLMLVIVRIVWACAAHHVLASNKQTKQETSSISLLIEIPQTYHGINVLSVNQLSEWPSIVQSAIAAACAKQYVSLFSSVMRSQCYGIVFVIINFIISTTTSDHKNTCAQINTRLHSGCFVFLEQHIAQRMAMVWWEVHIIEQCKDEENENAKKKLSSLFLILRS